MQRAEVTEALDYLAWARDRILAAASLLPDEAFRTESTVTTRGLRATLVHQLECEWAWRVRLTEGAFPENGLAVDAFPTVASLAERFRAEEQARADWLAGLPEAALDDIPRAGRGLALWRHLLYLVNHGTQQFSEAAVLLTRAGASPGEIGYLEFCLERSGAARQDAGARPERGNGVPTGRRTR